MTRKRNRRARKANAPNQAISLNSQSYTKYMTMMVAILLNRFRIEGLPNTCDSRFLLWCLLRYGIATIAHPSDMPDAWMTLQAVPKAEYNAYGVPLSWRAMGADGKTQFDCDDSNGCLIWYSRSSAAPYRFGLSNSNPWLTLDNFAQRLAKYERTEEMNLLHQFIPYVFVGPEEKKIELENLVNMVFSGQPAVIGNGNMYDLIEKISVIDTKVPLITEDLARSKLNVWNEFLLFAGVPHLAFEKGERMIEQEALANTAPTNMMLLDCLDGMRDGFEKFNEISGYDVQVYFNEDWESYNYNYVNNIEAVVQDGGLNNV